MTDHDENDEFEFVSDYVTIDTVAYLLNISRSSVVRALDRRDIKRVKLTSGLVRVHMPSVWAWVEKSTDGTPAASGA